MNSKLYEFISKAVLVDIKILNKSTRLEQDLKLFGDEAAEFIYDYGIEFGVDMKDFDFEKYFTKETDFYFMYKLFPSLNTKKRELTINDLIKGAEKKYLNDAVIDID